LHIFPFLFRKSAEIPPAAAAAHQKGKLRFVDSAKDAPVPFSLLQKQLSGYIMNTSGKMFHFFPKEDL